MSYFYKVIVQRNDELLSDELRGIYDQVKGLSM